MGTTAQKLEYLQGTKDALKTQLTAKGVAVPSNTTFRQMANLVGNIQTGTEIEYVTGTFVAEKVRAGFRVIYVSEDGAKVVEVGTTQLTVRVQKNSIIGCGSDGSFSSFIMGSNIDFIDASGETSPTTSYGYGIVTQDFVLTGTG